MLLSSMILNNTIKVKKIPAENERLVKLETGVILLNFKNIYVVSSPTEIRRGVQASAQNKKWLSNFLKLSKNYRFSKKVHINLDRSKIQFSSSIGKNVQRILPKIWLPKRLENANAINYFQISI